MGDNNSPKGWADVSVELVRSRWFPWMMFFCVSGLLAVVLSTGSGIEMGPFKIQQRPVTNKEASFTSRNGDPSAKTSGDPSKIKEVRLSGWDIDYLLPHSAHKGIVGVEIQLPQETDANRTRKATLQYKIRQQQPQAPLSHTTWVRGNAGFHMTYVYLPVTLQVRIKLDDGDWSAYSESRTLDAQHPACGFIFRAY